MSQTSPQQFLNCLRKVSFPSVLNYVSVLVLCFSKVSPNPLSFPDVMQIHGFCSLPKNNKINKIVLRCTQPFFIEGVEKAVSNTHRTFPPLSTQCLKVGGGGAVGELSPIPSRRCWSMSDVHGYPDKSRQSLTERPCATLHQVNQEVAI